MSTPDTSPGDELDEILANLYKRIVNSSGKYYAGDPAEILSREAKDRLNRLMLTRMKSELVKLKQEMQMHTVPEGRDLITRSYLNNSIDFQVAAIDAQLNKEEK